jgi:rubrerythrin
MPETRVRLDSPTERVHRGPTVIATRGDFRCATCGYGVSVYRSLPRCPMCGSNEWLDAARPHSSPRLA